MDVNLIVATIEAAAPGLQFELVRATADGVLFQARRGQAAPSPTLLLAAHLRLLLTRHCGYLVSTSVDRGELTLVVVYPAQQPLKNWRDYLPRTYGAGQPLSHQLAA